VDGAEFVKDKIKVSLQLTVKPAHCQNHSFVSCAVFRDSVLVPMLRILKILCNLQHRRDLCQSRPYEAEHALLVPYLDFRYNSSWDTTLDWHQF